MKTKLRLAQLKIEGVVFSIIFWGKYLFVSGGGWTYRVA